jgi:segregation and condensation protein B
VSEAGLVPVGPGREPGVDEPSGGASVADIEALLFVAERPLTRAELRTLGRLSAEEVDERLGDLEMQLRERGIRLVSSGDRVMLGTSPESGPLIARYLGADAVRLSPAALETLAIIAYRQPVTRAEIEQIRGVTVSRGTLDLLVETGWVRPRGRKAVPGRPVTWVTTPAFLDHFGLQSRDDLPRLEELTGAGLFDNVPPDEAQGE